LPKEKEFVPYSLWGNKLFFSEAIDDGDICGLGRSGAGLVNQDLFLFPQDVLI